MGYLLGCRVVGRMIVDRSGSRLKVILNCDMWVVICVWIVVLLRVEV